MASTWSYTANTVSSRSSQEIGPCFRCLRAGHWARDCPEAKLGFTPHSTPQAKGLPCPCGAGICPPQTSHTDKNPGRRFYTCPNSCKKTGCGFLKWLDQVNTDQLINVPICQCGAGPCQIRREASGPNAGRSCFVCPIKKGQGACNYTMWLDVPATNDASGKITDGSTGSTHPTVIECNDNVTITTNSDTTEQGDLSCSEPEIELSTSIDDSVDFQNRGAVLSVILENLRAKEETSLQPSRRNKRLRHGDIKVNAHILGSSGKDLNNAHITASAQDLGNIHILGSSEQDLDNAPTCGSTAQYQDTQQTMARSFLGQKEVQDSLLETNAIIGLASPFRGSSSTCFPAILMHSTEIRDNWWMIAAFAQDLSIQLRGWWGRLAFPPRRCLIVPDQSPSFCCPFPSDPAFVPEVMKTLDLTAPKSCPWTTSAISQAPPASDHDIWISGTSLQKLNLNMSPVTEQSIIMNNLVLKAFEQAAEHLQSDLINLLLSMDIQDHETMAREANTTFSALDQLLVDHQNFKERVKKFIEGASLLAGMECGTSTIDLFTREKLTERCSSEKLKFEQLSSDYTDAFDALTTSKEHLGNFSEEVCLLKDKLLQAETEYSCCEVETASLEARVVQISEEMEVSGNALKELQDALKLCEKKEAAKVAYEKAKDLLRL